MSTTTNKVVILSKLEKSSICKEGIECTTAGTAAKHAGGKLYDVVGIPWVAANERV